MPLKNEDSYRVENKRMVLVDEELGLDVDVPFDPVLLPKNPRWGIELADGHFVTGNPSGSEFFVEKDSRPNGQCLLFYSSKAVKGEMYYQNGKLHGPSMYYTEEGGALSKGWFVNGLQQGKLLWFYPDGKLYSLQKFKDGLLHGRQEYYHQDGSTKTALMYKMGILVEVTKANLRS